MEEILSLVMFAVMPLWGTFIVKRLSFEGIYGLLHKNELNEKGKGLKSKEMKPTYDPYILH